MTTTRSPTLAMTLLVRNEIDIVRANIEFHLSQGVDFIVATDNGSEDGTREVLSEFERNGVLYLFDEAGRDYAQAAWVTRMATFARDRLGADWILNNDADEFWTPVSGSLKDELGKARSPVLVCRRQNMVFAHDGSPGSWQDSLVYRVARAVRRPRRTQRLIDAERAPLSHPLLYIRLKGKALCRAQGLTRVHYGNHWANYGRWPGWPRRSQSILIYHFPIRSYEHFVRKVREGGAACEEAGDQLGRSQIWHWRRWYKQWQRGDELQAFREALPSAERIENDLRSGRLILDHRFCTEPNATAAIG